MTDHLLAGLLRADLHARVLAPLGGNDESPACRLVTNVVAHTHPRTGDVEMKDRLLAGLLLQAPRARGDLGQVDLLAGL